MLVFLIHAGFVSTRRNDLAVARIGSVRAADGLRQLCVGQASRSLVAADSFCKLSVGRYTS